MVQFWRSMTLVLASLLLSACTIQLAPDYDSALVDGLNANNVDALTLFAALEGGSDQANFSEFADDYAETIGAFEALRQRAETRPIPRLASRLDQVSFISDICNAQVDANECINASPAAIGTVVSTLQTVRRRHRDDGLPADLVELFKGQYMAAIRRALFVEQALER